MVEQLLMGFLDASSACTGLVILMMATFVAGCGEGVERRGARAASLAVGGLVALAPLALAHGLWARDATMAALACAGAGVAIAAAPGSAHGRGRHT